MLPPARRDAELTAHERAILTASATGLSVSEVAELLGESPADVRRLIASARRKLRAGSKLEAVVLALKRKLISPPP